MFKYIFLLLIFFTINISGEYKNTNGKEIDKSIKDLIRWQRNQKKPVLAYIDLSEEWLTSDLDRNHTIWIGHSTFIIKIDNLTILTDPVFSERASPFKRFGPKSQKCAFNESNSPKVARVAQRGKRSNKV